MANLVQDTDVEAALLRPLTDAESTYIAALIDQAEGLLRARIPDIDARIAARGTGDPKAIDPAVVAAVLAQVIARFLRSPDGAISVSQTAGPYSTTRSLQANASPGLLTITDADIAAILPATASIGARTIQARSRLPWL